MALKSSDPKENDKILKKKLFHHFGGFRAPPKPPKTLKRGGFRGAGNPPKLGREFFFKILLFSLAYELSRTIFIFDFQFQEVF